jgi:hypothetical protein
VSSSATKSSSKYTTPLKQTAKFEDEGKQDAVKNLF